MGAPAAQVEEPAVGAALHDGGSSATPFVPPTVVLSHILQHLDLSELMLAGVVNKQWHAVCKTVPDAHLKRILIETNRAIAALHLPNNDVETALKVIFERTVSEAFHRHDSLVREVTDEAFVQHLQDTSTRLPLGTSRLVHYSCVGTCFNAESTLSEVDQKVVGALVNAFRLVFDRRSPLPIEKGRYLIDENPDAELSILARAKTTYQHTLESRDDRDSCQGMRFWAMSMDGNRELASMLATSPFELLHGDYKYNLRVCKGNGGFSDVVKVFRAVAGTPQNYPKDQRVAYRDASELTRDSITRAANRAWAELAATLPPKLQAMTWIPAEESVAIIQAVKDEVKSDD
jgi:hypothetical protein